MNDRVNDNAEFSANDYDSEGFGAEVDLTFGVNFEDVKSQRGAIPPESGEHTFRITKVSSGTQAKGKSTGSKYFTCWCVVIDGEGVETGQGISQFCGLDKTLSDKGYSQIGSTKAFLEDICRQDIMHADGRPADLKGTEFTAEVYRQRNRSTGEDEARMRKLRGLSDAAEPVAKPEARPVATRAAAPAPSAARPPARPRAR